MIYLLLAIVSSALISVIMRLSADRVTGNVSMLAMNYLMCLLIAACYTGFDALAPNLPGLPRTLGLGCVNGVLYLMGFVLFQRSVRRSGVVLSSTFMKLGLLVPMVVSVFLFGELPTAMQAVGFCVAVAGIVLVNLKKDRGQVTGGLLLLLLACGSADAMAKIYGELGAQELSSQFLLYTFASAFLLCCALVWYRKEHLGWPEVCFGFLIGIPNYYSARFLLLAVREVSAVIVYPTYSVATILAVTVVGVSAFRERLGKRQWLALAIILAALVLLNI